MEVTIQTVDTYRHVLKNVDEYSTTKNFVNVIYEDYTRQFSVPLNKIMWLDIQRYNHD
jgi:hypothetical protein